VGVALRLTSLAAGGVLAAAAVAGCGQQSADVFVAHRTGTIPGAELRLRVVDDGQVSCNGGALRELPSKLLIDSRVTGRDLEDPAKRGVTLAPRPGSTLSYAFRIGDGVVRFSDTSRGQAPAFYSAAFLVRRIAQQACGLPR
jgi:hypothetical protein